MKPTLVHLAVIGLLTASAVWAAQPKRSPMERTPQVRVWLDTVDRALADAASASDVDAAVETLSKELGGSPAADPLREAETLDGKRRALRAVREQVGFRPLKEADFPGGFPDYTPEGVVELKAYPAYRKAVAQQFFTLFRHITGNDIAMTAPVEMRLDESEGRIRQSSMAFLYGEADLGAVGKQGAVEVVDVPSQTVVSIGVRGKITPTVERDAKRSLETWLRRHEDYRVAGPLRRMSYNSPFVPDGDKFHEFQYPVERTPTED